jgi:NADH dehydrogenase FAD-containing subunit
MITTAKKMQIVIVGGGFAGLGAAMYLDKTLARRPDIEVTLVSRENFVLFTPMLHEVAAGELLPWRHRQSDTAHSSSREICPSRGTSC